MLLIAGLGNPGEKYKNTRHNVGFMYLDFLLNSLTTSYQLQAANFTFDKYVNAEIAKINLQATDYQLQAIVAKPQTYMNRSGESIAKIIRNYELRIKNKENVPRSTLHVPHLFVAHDDLDIELGKFKIQLGVGPKKHNGLSSIEDHLHTKDFWRIRIGVDNRKGDRNMSGEAYVLQNFTPAEQDILRQTFSEIIPHLLTIL